MNNDTLPGMTTNQHIHKAFISYANTLKGDSQTYDDKLTVPLPSANKRPVSIIYELLLDEEASANKKKSKSNNQHSQSKTTPNNTNDSELFNKKWFLERLVDNNAKVKMEIMTTFKAEIQKANTVVTLGIKQANV